MELFVLQNMLKCIVFHVIWMLFTYAIIQNVLERKDSMAECYQRASERACVTSPLFGQGTTSYFFLMFLFIHNHLTLRKWWYTPLQHDFALDPMIPPFLPFFKHLSRDYEKTTITAMYHGSKSDSRETWKCADPELEKQIRCFPYV
jgi:hypothetical protein